ncbi:Lrp/AsnC family transcriptional regulator [Roseovarius pelagicus]|uniref:Lrp/AsnC family transcriptional regulator n=1 Tax=Roseovarius pelagicus TaxID=2980108 RepID=A0ABY6D997_9RHOB|nr:Lrp/AsnC family transcriptional regulator [Roseovarius pelagicus]UXX82658.1 Lrp/AsnC family transcriptional regulator [Roseovarius pelagicus]
MQNIEIDTVDMRILAQLQRDTRISIASLAELAGASTASIQRRLKRLRNSGVIKAEVAQLDAQALGFGITAVVSVELERDRLDQIDAFKRKARAEPHVQHFYCVAGECDFFIIVVARDMADYEAFTHRFFFADRNVRKFRTSIAVACEKATLALPI